MLIKLALIDKCHYHASTLFMDMNGKRFAVLLLAGGDFP